MNSVKAISTLGLCVAACAAMLSMSTLAQAGAVDEAIAAGQLSETDAVAYMVYGLEDGGRPPQIAGKVTWNPDLGGFDIKYDVGRGEKIVRKIGDCQYQVTSRHYSYTALVGPQPDPEVITFDLDFSKMTRALVIKRQEGPSTIDLFGLACTPRENAEDSCAALAKSELYTAADGPTLVKTVAYFHEKYCPLTQ